MKRIIGFVFLSIVLNFHSQVNIPKRGYAVDWILPAVSSNPTLKVFDKIELGINVHDSIERQINPFFDENQQGNTKKINPFNAQDIEIYAEFRQNKNESVKIVSAFYFEELVYDNVKYLTKSKFQTRFRIRFVPDFAANWNFKVYIKIKNKLVLTLGEYEFTCVETSSQSEKKVCSTHFNPCFGNDLWQKDLWMSMFSGLKEEDIHWPDFQNYKTRENFNAIKSYSEEYRFNTLNFFTNKEKCLSKNKCVEVLALHHLQYLGSTGLVANKTWNYFTEGKSNCVLKLKPTKKLRKFNEQKSSDLNSQVQITNFEKNHEYQIEWFNPTNNESISKGKIKSSNEGIVVLEYPTLTKTLPYIIYKLE